MTRDFFRWHGHQVCVSAVGKGTPLLLVPGIGCGADLWEPFIPYFPNRHVVCFDAPGAGRSSTPMFPIPVESLAALAVAVLDSRGIECCDVIGFSYGGAVAQQLAYDHPQRVRRLVLAATTCGWGSYWGSPGALAVMATPLRFYSASYFDRVAPHMYGGVTRRDPVRRQGALHARRRLPPSAYAYAMQMLGGMNWSSFRFLPEIRHETLVMCGDDDPLVPIANAKMLADRIPRATLEVVERAGHLLLWDEPERVAPQIGKFVGWS